ncbi:MAG: hypothetical protein ACPGVU_27210 [Limisphaerales bacterium]
MKLAIYQTLHVGAMVMMVAILWTALANPEPGRKGKVMMWIHLLAIVMLVGGFGALAVLKVGFPWWVIVKVVCWLGLLVIASLAYRMPQKVGLLRVFAIILVLGAIGSVYLKGSAYE